MSDLLFPAIPATSREITYGRDYRTVVHQTISGREDRTSFSAVRRHWVITYQCRDAKAAPSPYAAYTERSVIDYFFDTHQGQLDSFLFVDPGDSASTQRRVRFASDVLDWKRISTFGLWEVQVEFIECLPGDQGTSTGAGPLDPGGGLYS